MTPIADIFDGSPVAEFRAGIGLFAGMTLIYGGTDAGFDP